MSIAMFFVDVKILLILLFLGVMKDEIISKHVFVCVSVGSQSDDIDCGIHSLTAKQWALVTELFPLGSSDPLDRSWFHEVVARYSDLEVEKLLKAIETYGFLDGASQALAQHLVSELDLASLLSRIKFPSLFPLKKTIRLKPFDDMSL
jgi:hypothetical protein